MSQHNLEEEVGDLRRSKRKRFLCVDSEVLCNCAVGCDQVIWDRISNFAILLFANVVTLLQCTFQFLVVKWSNLKSKRASQAYSMDIFWQISGRGREIDVLMLGLSTV